MSDYDAFQDVIEGVNGIFGAEQAGLDSGLKKHDSVHAKATPRALVFQLNCQGCGKPTHLEVEWPELVALKYGVNPVIAFRGRPNMLQSPTRWEFRPAEQAWRPEIKCRNCGFHVPLRVAPDEPERHLAVARRREFINQQGEHAVAQICAQAAAGGAAVRR